MGPRSLIIIGVISFFGCVEPYEFTVTETVEALVVDAVFTNEQKAHQVKLSLSGSLDSKENSPVSGASVWIIEGAGKQIDLTEGQPGIYETGTNVQGTPGVSYTLFIELKNGERFASSTEVLPVPVVVDSIYGKYIELPSTADDQILRGVQFFVDTHDDLNEFSNFRYEFIEDYEIRVPYPSLFDWDQSTETYSVRDIDVGTCYGHQESIGLAIATTHGQSQNRLTEFPITMVSPDDGRLNSRYSLTVMQYTISAATYQYYKSLKENNESSGSFFDRQKGTIQGNILHVADSGVPILGYFELSGVSRTTAFFVSDEYEDQGFLALNPLRFDCASPADSVEVAALNNSTMSGQNIIGFTFPIADYAILVTAPCSDCRHHGQIEKPDFWD